MSTVSIKTTRSRRSNRRLQFWKQPSHRRSRSRVVRSPMKGRTMPGFPASKKVIMRYAQVIMLDAAAGAVASFDFRATSISDPDVASGVPKRPLGYTQWSQFYNHYQVTDCKITASFSGADANLDPMIMGIYVADDSTIPGNSEAIIEQGLAHWKIGSPGTNNSTKAITVTNSVNVKKYFNVTDLKDNFARLGAIFGEDPDDIIHFHVFVQALNNLADPPTLFIQCILEFQVLFSEPRSLPQSV